MVFHWAVGVVPFGFDDTEGRGLVGAELEAEKICSS